MKEFRLIIAGTRTFNDFNLLVTTCDNVLINVKKEYKIVIVSGKATGADTLGEKYAHLRGYSVAEFPADWDNLNVAQCKIKYNKYGKPYNALAGLNRNMDMANYALQGDYCGCLAFHDGKSTGTKHMISLAKSKGINCIVKHF